MTDELTWLMNVFYQEAAVPAPVETLYTIIALMLSDSHNISANTTDDMIWVLDLLLEETFPVMTEQSNWSLDMDQMELFPAPIDDDTWLLTTSLEDTVSWEPSEDITSSIMLMETESFPTPIDSVSIYMTINENETIPIPTESHVTLIGINGTEVIPSPTDQILEYKFFYVDAYDGAAFWYPSVSNHGSYSYTINSKLNTNTRTYTKKYKDELVTLTLV